MAWPRRFLRGALLVLLACSLVERSLLVLAWTGSVSAECSWSVLGLFFGSFPGTFFAWTLSGPFLARSLFPFPELSCLDSFWSVLCSFFVGLFLVRSLFVRVGRFHSMECSWPVVSFSRKALSFVRYHLDIATIEELTVPQQ